jgi:hypothetical protein
MFSDNFPCLNLNDETTFQKLALLPSSGEQPNQLDPLVKGNLSLQVSQWTKIGCSLMAEVKLGSETMCSFF